MKIKRLLAIIVLSFNLLLTGCWSSHEVNTLGISVCLGIDKSNDGYIISEQVINPKAIASKRATNESPIVVYTGEGKNIQETITRLTTLAPRKIYHSHLRMVIFSEEVAKEGIVDIIDYLLRYHEFRTDYYFAIAKGTSAKEILSILTPVESIPGISMFNILKMSFEEWAPTKATRIVELTNNLSADGINPTINAVSLVDDKNKTDSTDILRKSGDFEKLRFVEIGAFQKDKLVGWLNESESKGLNYITNEVKHTSGFNTGEDGVEIAVDVLKSKTKIKASVVNNQPQIDVEVKFSYVINEVKGNLDVSKVENIETINKIHEEKVTEICNNAVKKAQELKTDIFGFGERIHAKDPTYWNTVKDNWNDVFATIPVNIKVTAEIVATGDITKTILQKE